MKLTGTNRISPKDVSPETYKAIAAVDQTLYRSTLGKPLIELI